jgi:hypothetical protein
MHLPILPPCRQHGRIQRISWLKRHPTQQQFEIIGVSNGIAYGTASLSDSAKGGVIQYSVAKVGATR